MNGDGARFGTGAAIAVLLGVLAAITIADDAGASVSLIFAAVALFVVGWRIYQARRDRR